MKPDTVKYYIMLLATMWVSVSVAICMAIHTMGSAKYLWFFLIPMFLTPTKIREKYVSDDEEKTNEEKP